MASQGGTSSDAEPALPSLPPPPPYESVGPRLAAPAAPVAAAAAASAAGDAVDSAARAAQSQSRAAAAEAPPPYPLATHIAVPHHVVLDAGDYDSDDENAPMVARAAGKQTVVVDVTSARKGCTRTKLAATLCFVAAVVCILAWAMALNTAKQLAPEPPTTMPVHPTRAAITCNPRLVAVGDVPSVAAARAVFLSKTLLPAPTAVNLTGLPSAGQAHLWLDRRVIFDVRHMHGTAHQWGVEQDILGRTMDIYCPDMLSSMAKAPIEAVTMPNVVNRVEIILANVSSAHPQFPMAEDYQLTIDAPTVFLKADTIWGAIRGIETLSQLVASVEYPGYLLGAGYRIIDSPRFPWRGLSMDTSRHFIPVRTLKRTLRAMAASKMNTMHWHMVDGQAFPLYLESHPELSQKGAWDQHKIYSPDDVQEIISYARDLAIRVMPEIDMPSHAASWGRGRPDIVANCSEFASAGPYWKYFDKIALNPAIEETYTVLKDVVDEVAAAFPDKFFHIGGDEVQHQCWSGDSSGIPAEQLAAFKNRTKLDGGVLSLVKYFNQRITAIVEGAGKSIMMWQDTYDDLFEETASHINIEPWKCWGGLGDGALSRAVRADRGSVQSMCWYLDYDSTWADYYNHDPFPKRYPIDPQYAPNVWGGEAAVWTERIDATNFDCRIWPRAAAIAEIFWSPAGPKVAADLLPRLQAHRERLFSRGIEAAEMNDRLAKKYPGDGYGRCPPIEQVTQRPVDPAFHKFLQYNIEDGGHFQDELLAWIRSRNADVVGLVEAVGWANPVDPMNTRGTGTSVDPAGMAQRAALAGFPYAVLFQTKSTYSLAIMAVHPIRVIEENDTDFERGMLVVEIHGLVFMVVHLHAHDATLRSKETLVVAAKAKELTEQGWPVIVMGDMNTLSPLDADWHVKEDLVGFLEDPRAPERLIKKYMVDGKLAYQPMANLLDSGLNDLCTERHWEDQNTHTVDSPCLFTEPTKMSMVPAAENQGLHVPPFRLDYGLGNSFAKALGVECGVVQNADTDMLSDHYPVECRYPKSKDEEVNGYDWRRLSKEAQPHK